MALGDSSFPTHVALFQQALSEGKVVMASDGSLQGSNDASQGWKLQCRQENTGACGHGVVESGGNEMSSALCAEMVGFLGGLVDVDTLLSTYHLIKNSHNPQCLEVYLDNKALISRIQMAAHRIIQDSSPPDYDLLQASMQIAKKQNITVIPYHGKSDLEIAYNELLWEAKLSCDVDSLANQTRTCTR